MAYLDGNDGLRHARRARPPRPTARTLSPVGRLMALRREAGLSRARCAAACGLSPANYGKLERGQFDERMRDPVGLRLPLARLLSAALGRAVSAQWDLCGTQPPTPRQRADRAADPIGSRGCADPRARAARSAVHPRPTTEAGLVEQPGAGRVTTLARWEAGVDQPEPNRRTSGEVHPAEDVPSGRSAQRGARGARPSRATGGRATVGAGSAQGDHAVGQDGAAVAAVVRGGQARAVPGT